MKIALPRGMRDLDPQEYDGVETIRSAFLDTCRLFGFRLMEPSPLELLETLEAKSGPSITDGIYHFEDKGGRKLGLRFDLTVGLTRYAISRRDLKLPARLAAFGGMWRYDEPQYGRYRWFNQWDIEIFGNRHVEADAETIEFTRVLLDKLGLGESVIAIGDRNVVETFIRSILKVEEDHKIVTFMRALDKASRKTVDEILDEYSSHGLKREELHQLLEFSGIEGEPLKVIESLSSRSLDAGKLLELFDELKSRGVANTILHMGIVRGLEYYTGIVFEAFDPKDTALGAICGGGRYDTLPAALGREDMSATGVAGGVERTLMAMAGGVRRSPSIVYVASPSTACRPRALELASALRAKGLATIMHTAGMKLSRQLEEADRLSATYAVLVGEREMGQRAVTLRDLRRRSETEVPLEELYGRLMEGMKT